MNDHDKVYPDDAPDVEDFKNLFGVERQQAANALVQRGGFKFHAVLDVLEKAKDRPDRTIVGYANTKNVDRMDDIVEPGAFRASLKHYVKNGNILAHHDHEKVVGLPDAASIDDKGLLLTGHILKGNDPADPIERVWNVIKQRGIKSFSVGFRILPGGVEFDKDEDGKQSEVRRITKLELYEVSVVAIPANRQSLFSVAKGMLNGNDLVAVELTEIVNEDFDNYAEVFEFVKDVGDKIDAHVDLERMRNVTRRITEQLEKE